MRQKLGRERANNAGNVVDNRIWQSAAFALALCVAVTAPAVAADLPTAAPIPPPVYKEPPIVYNWTGVYIGGNIGAAWSGLSGTNFSDTLGSTFTAPTNVQFMGGGQSRRELPVLGWCRYRRRGNVRLASPHRKRADHGDCS